MSIKNYIEGASAVGTVPTGGQLTATLPNSYSANCHPLQAVALVRLSSGLSQLVNYIPIPQGSIILDAYLDPIQAPGTAFNIQLGNETGGDADFGTLAVLASSNLRVTAATPVVGAAYAGVRGNSIKLTFSALPTMADAEKGRSEKGKHVDPHEHAEQREPDQREHAKHHADDKGNGKKDKRKADSEQAAREEAEQKNDPQAYELERKAQAEAQRKETGSPAPAPIPDYPPRQEPGMSPRVNGAPGVAPLLGVPEFTLLATAMNGTTDLVVATTTSQPSVTLGSILQIGTEQMQVISISDTQHFVVLRGVNSTPKAGHAQNFPVYVNAVAGEGAFYAFVVIRYLMT